MSLVLTVSVQLMVLFLLFKEIDLYRGQNRREVNISPLLQANYFDFNHFDFSNCRLLVRPGFFG